MSGFFDKRFVINTGKGGVGKTVVSAAMALAFARRGKRVLLMQLNTPDRMGPLFGVPEVGTEIVEVGPNIWCVDTTPADALREYALMILKVRALYRAVFENRVVAKLLKVMPGLPELTMLGKAYFHEQERDASGKPKWDVVIIDAPATGHGMFLLQIPQVISSAVNSGRMAEESAAMLALLEDPARTVVNLITLPEEMPVNETLELQRQLAAEFDLQVGAVIANAVYAAGVADEPLDALEPDALDADARALVALGRFRRQRCALQREHLARLRTEVDAPFVQLPFVFSPAIGRDAIEALAGSFEQGISASPQQGRA